MTELGRIGLNERTRKIVADALAAKEAADARFQIVVETVLAASEVEDVTMVRLEGGALVCLGPGEMDIRDITPAGDDGAGIRTEDGDG